MVRQFTIWQQEITELQEKISKNPLQNSISETITAQGNIYTVTLGETMSATVNGIKCQFGQLRGDYTNRKEEFDSLLDGLKKRVEEINQATDAILNVISEEAVPAAVIKRMAGEEVSGESVDLIENRVRTLVFDMGKRLSRRLGNFKPEFDGYLRPVAGRMLELETSNGNLSFTWGQCRFNEAGAHIGSAEECIFFIGNAVLIEKRLVEAIDVLVQIKRLTVSP